MLFYTDLKFHLIQSFELYAILLSMPEIVFGEFIPIQ